MDSFNGPSIVAGSIMLFVLIAALVARRSPLGTMLKYAAIWAVIFGGMYVLFLFRDDFGGLVSRAQQDVSGQSVSQNAQGRTITIRRADDGHFWLRASVLGHETRFLIDSGATDTVLTPESAAASGLDRFKPDRATRVATANGASNAWPIGPHRVEIDGSAVENVDMAIADDGLDTNLLGMSFLNRLKSWSVEGNRLVLTLR